MLLTPGPTNIPQFLHDAMTTRNYHHQSKEYKAIFKQVRQKCLQLIDMSDCILVASSGTGSMEACVSNFTQKKALVLSSGKFGERFALIAKNLNIPYCHIQKEWDTKIKVDEAIYAIKHDDDIDSVFLSVCESSSGLRQDYEEITKAIKELKPNMTVCIDAITAVGVEKINHENVDAVICGSQKAFMLPPGLSMVWVSEYAKKVLSSNNTKRAFYFDLDKELSAQNSTNCSACTPATTLILGLNASLDRYFEFGVEELYKKSKLRALATREALGAIGLEQFIENGSYCMSVFKTNKSDSIREYISNKANVHIAGGQGILSGKIIRISHMGFIPDYELAWCINSIELALDNLGIRKFDGTANAIFSKLILNS